MRCVILDDYQDVARSYADWSALPDVAVEAVREHVADHDRLVEIVGGRRDPGGHAGADAGAALAASSACPGCG